MDIKPVAWRHFIHLGGEAYAWTAWTDGEVPMFGTLIKTENAYPQAAIDALTAEVERLRKHVPVALRGEG